MRENALKAVADPTRRRILELVRQEPSSVGDIARHFDTTQQAISQHLQLLRNAGLAGVQEGRDAPPLCRAHRRLRADRGISGRILAGTHAAPKAAAEAGKKGR